MAGKPGMCNREIVRRGALILFCDYVVSREVRGVVGQGGFCGAASQIPATSSETAGPQTAVSTGPRSGRPRTGGVAAGSWHPLGLPVREGRAKGVQGGALTSALFVMRGKGLQYPLMHFKVYSWLNAIHFILFYF